MIQIKANFIFLLIISGLLLVPKAAFPSSGVNKAEDLNSNSTSFFEADFDHPLTIQNNSAIASNSHFLDVANYKAQLDTVYVFVTAYSSDPAETDGDPFITASGSFVHWGTAATNFLPFGTKIQIPEIFGDEIFIIKDRMHRSKRYVVDIWHPSKQEAVNFGARLTYIKIIDG